MARFSTRRIEIIETTIPCPSCGTSMTVSVTEPHTIYCGNSTCAAFGVMRKS